MMPVMGLLVVSAAMSAMATTVAHGAGRPNVLFIVIDDLGFDDVGFRSHEIRTPVIDGLAANGVVLDQYYVQDVCSPSRSTFMTGRYSMHNTIVDWIPPASPYGLPLNETTLAEKFNSAGYISYAVGKWHLGFYKWEMTPTFRGFSSFVGFYSGGEDYFSHQAGAAYDFRRDTRPRCGKGCSQVDWQDKGVYSTTVFSREACNVVAAHPFAEKHLFLYLAYQGVHAPAQVPDSYIEPYRSTIADPKRQTFAGMLSAVDEGIGNVTQALAAAKALDNTLIVFTADNGGPTTTGDGVGARNWPLRGGKHSIWEGGTRATGFVTGTPILAAALARGDASRTFAGLMHGADWLPSLATVAGFNTSDTLPLDGVSQWLAITGAASPPRSKIVIGNSTNMCSWAVGDPRHHLAASPGRDGADLPAGYWSATAGSADVAKALGCGFAIKDYSDAGHHWKLIKGYGGGPDTWCNSTAHGADCGEPSAVRRRGLGESAAEDLGGANCTVMPGLCFPQNDIRHFMVSNADACCDACNAVPSCVGFTVNADNKSAGGPTCYLKTRLNTSIKSQTCVSGSNGRPPAPPLPPPPPPPPEPVSVCPDGWCLYDTASDPHEEHEVSSANREVVVRMQADLVQVLQSYHQYEDDKSCPPQAYGNDPHVGKTWEPWC